MVGFVGGLSTDPARFVGGLSAEFYVGLSGSMPIARSFSSSFAALASA